jgi:uridine kinase
MRLRNPEAQRATLVAVSGIDASGKGYLSRELAQRLREQACRVALISEVGNRRG